MSMLEQFEIDDLTDLLARHVAEEKQRPRAAGILHRWWGRRPFVLARIAAYLTLTEGQAVDPVVLDQLGGVAPSTPVIRDAIASVREASWRRAWQDGSFNADDFVNGGDPGTPLVLDPFAGTGPIPAEATRLGCNATAGDLDPIAYHLLRAGLEYPVRFGAADPSIQGSTPGTSWRGLESELDMCARRAESLAVARVRDLYPIPSTGNDIPRYYIWFQVATCDKCTSQYPIQLNQPVRGRHPQETQYLTLAVTPSGYVSAISPTPTQDRRPGARFGVMSSRPVCTVCGAKHIDGAVPPRPTDTVLAAIVWGGEGAGAVVPVSPQQAQALVPWSTAHETRLNGLRQAEFATALEGSLPLPTFQAWAGLGRTKFEQLFTRRQLLTNLEFSAGIDEVLRQASTAGVPDERVSALRTYLSFLLGYLIERNSMLTAWRAQRSGLVPAFDRITAIPRLSANGVFVEQLPVGVGEAWLERAIPAVRSGMSLHRPTRVVRADAGHLPFADASFDAIVTDPPFFDLVPYEDLAAFFWAWEAGLLSHMTPPIDRSTLSSADVNNRENRGTSGPTEMTRAFGEGFRVLKAGRIFSMLLTARTEQHFGEYVELAQRAGFELMNVRRIREEWRPKLDHRLLPSREPVDQPSTFLISFRKPVAPLETPRVEVLTHGLLAAVASGRPVLYEGLAQAIQQRVPEPMLSQLIPAGTRGTTQEKLMEVLADQDPDQLLEEIFGRVGVVNLAAELGLDAPHSDWRGAVRAILEHYGFSVSSPSSVDGVEQTLSLLRRQRSLALAARSKSEIRGTFLEGCTAVERLFRLAIWGWATRIFSENRDASLLGMLGFRPNQAQQLSRLTLGQILKLFRGLPAAAAASPLGPMLEQKFASRLVYDTDDSLDLAGRFDAFVQARNRVEHDRDGYWTASPDALLREDCAAALQAASDLVADATSSKAIPRVATATHEILDRYGRASYRFLLDDGSATEAFLSTRIPLGIGLLYFGSGANPRPVDPLILPLTEVGPIP